MKSELDFCYKGSRDYVHGSDIYNELNAFVSKDIGLQRYKQIDITFHKIARNHLALEVFVNEQSVRTAETVAVFSFQSNDDLYTVLLSERVDPVDCRYSYAEKDISDLCHIDVERQSIQLNELTVYTDIEVFIAMNKALLQALYPEVTGKWFLARFQTGQYTSKSTYGSLSITLERNFNFKLTKSQITRDGEPVGTIFFSMIQGF